MKPRRILVERKSSKSKGPTWSEALSGLSHNLTNAFGTAWGRELRETEALVASVLCAYDSSDLRSIDPVRLAADSGREALAAAGHYEAPPALMYAVAAGFYEVLVDDGLLERPTAAIPAQMSAESLVHLRRQLRRKKAFFADTAAAFDRWTELTTDTFAGMLDYLPPQPQLGDDDDEQAVSVALIDLLEDPEVVIDRLFVTWLTRPEADAALFNPEIAEQLLRNLRLASGVAPDDDRRDDRLILPSDTTGLTPKELVDRYLGQTPFAVFFAIRLPLAIPDQVRFEHCHILGGTGHGKTQLLQRLIHQDLKRALVEPRSVVVIDSQGDLIDQISHLSCFDPEDPGGLADRLVLIDPTDIDSPPALNLFDAPLSRAETYTVADRERLIAGTIELYEYLFRSVFGAELTQKQGIVFSYLARLLIAIPNATIATFRDLLENGEPYRSYMQSLDGSAAHFFETEFFDRSFSATKQQLRRRLWGVFANPTLERMFSHPTNRVDLFTELNRGSIVLINTAKDILKQTGCEVAGRFTLALLGQATLERAALPPERRTPTLVYIDEAQDYFDEQIEGILTQARKYNVGITLAHQNLDQLEPRLRATFAANTSVKFAGGVSAKDARALSDDMRCSPDFLGSMRKRGDQTEFAGFIKNITPHALRIAVPLGALDKLPRLTEAEYEALRERNREKYCGRLADMPIVTPPPPSSGSSPARNEVPRTAAPFGIAPGHTSPFVGKPTENAARPPRPERDASGKREENRQHTYLQHLIRAAAQERGFLVTAEDTVLDGAGRVDLSLSRDDCRIACEISVTTSPEHELGNVLKCLAAGYDQVLVISARDRHLKEIEKHVSAHLPADQGSQVLYLSPDDAIAVLSAAPSTAATEKTIRGYKVRVSHQPVSSAEGQARRDAVNKLIAQSVRSMRERSSD